MILAIVPLAVSAIGGYLLLGRGVIASFQDVTHRQIYQIEPTQRLRLLVWDALAPVDEFLDAADPAQPLAYRAARSRIETEFANLVEALSQEPMAQTIVARARDDWTAADRLATELIAVPLPPGDSRGVELMQRFHGEVAAASDKLGAIYNLVSADIGDDQAAANLFFERSIWLAGIAAAVSLLTIVAGVLLIGRIMRGSVDRLVNGAARFADGDRDHRIEVQVPPELHRVAEEFNRMIARIHNSEEILSDLAHRDSLTRLPNRRAFDESFTEMTARLQRTEGRGALLALDLDHFKHVNDTYGHAAGDALLRATADVMTRCVRPFDKVFRVGGEEFSILMPNVDLAAAREAAERLRRAIESNAIRFNGAEITITISIGIVEVTGTVEQAVLNEAADAALYRAKTQGRNRIVAHGDAEARDLNAA